MATTTSYATGVQAETVAQGVGRRRAQIGEAVLGLLFVAPVAIIAFIFELFPVAYGFFISMQGGVNVPEGFVGLANFVRVIGSLAYMLTLAAALVFSLVGYNMYRRGVEVTREGKGNFYRYLPVGYLTAFAMLAFFGILFTLDFVYALAPLGLLLIGVICYVLLQPRHATDETASDHHFLLVLNSWGVGLMTLSAVLLTWFTFYELHRISQPLLDVLSRVITNPRFNYVHPLLPQIAALFGIAACMLAIFVAHRIHLSADPDAEPRKHGFFGFVRWLFAAVALLFVIYVLGAQDMLRQTLTQLERVPRETLREFTRLSPTALADTVLQWNEVFTMLLGLGLIGLAYFFWSRAKHRESSSGMLSTLLIAIALMVGGWLFIGELPLAAARGDTQFYDSIIRTATYAFLTVPVQLSLGLLLAYMLFYEVRFGKGFYRLVFFMPYIAPTVATATVFAMLFSNSPDVGPVNQLLKTLGLPPQEWMRNPKGVFQIIAEIIGGPNVRLPNFLIGPSLPLVAAIIYAIWVFSGYNAVIFMNGLGNVPKEMFEAAQIDGAGRWQTFRHVVFPLISPTTFYLTLLAITGTFRTFAHIWVLRTPDMRGALDTTTVYIYETIQTASAIKTRPYAAAMSFLLFGIILILTLLQNRLTRDKVFYG
ncbi:MAG: hypothetical protein CUN49_12280 [Candidatus Thermofonsia Clade 1 bacterium]|jgi:multiple sugar transport system permease protein|uniref:ABC transmembrane type-1 domain-containing protein n=1 Tax=Candidatus Thermofonsia Clade 1 bacterium TaxID=2364210 RepID=A0A2M8PX42_9CHLR|nr:MAG: hypothetical protein CUN49_12280 [Candidatus Thermofonsia Clade 1 bacterium]PJF42108.1 MAG: hypothetical protein CUN50_05395 [Candidatus Thermofonsia Clade 1 bacterium]